MKQIIAIGAVLIAAYIIYDIYNAKGNVTKGEFKNYREEFRSEIDSLKRNQDTLKIEIRVLRNNQDTLKNGQYVIYKHITRRSESPSENDGNFFDNIINFLK